MRGEIINEYQKLNSEDLKTFRRWLQVNAAVVVILLAGLIVVATKFSGGESGATAQNAGMPTQVQLPVEPVSLPSR